MIEIYSANDSEWNNYLSLFDLINNQLHFTSEYHKLFSNHRNEPILFIFKQNSDCFFYPFMKRRINEDYYDITSVFGYTGPLITNQNFSFLADADKALRNFLYNENIVSELIRFNPIIDNHKIYMNHNFIKLLELKDYVVLETHNTINDLFSQIVPRLRTQIRKAERKFNSMIKLTVEPLLIRKFFELYETHMARLNANEYYFFDNKYYETLIELIQQNGFLLYAEEDNEIIAGLLIIYSNIVGYSHHNVRDVNKINSSLLNKFLNWKVIEILKEKEVDFYLLGGGVTSSRDDNLFKFKKDFGGTIKKLWLGKRIINEASYYQICQDWEGLYPHLKEKYSSYIDKFHYKS